MHWSSGNVHLADAVSERVNCCHARYVCMYVCRCAVMHQIFGVIHWELESLFRHTCITTAVGSIKICAYAVIFLSTLCQRVSPAGQMTVAMLLILWVSALASAFIDNIPFTAAIVSCDMITWL